MSARTLAFRYALFALVATGANLLTQRAFLIFGDSALVFGTALGAGTIVGLVLKFILDKRWIFLDLDRTPAGVRKKMSLYTFSGAFTTLVFWGTETLFWIIGRDETFRELGACIGLTIGYVLKYQLDKRITFKPLAASSGEASTYAARSASIVQGAFSPRPVKRRSTTGS